MQRSKGSRSRISLLDQIFHPNPHFYYYFFLNGSRNGSLNLKGANFLHWDSQLTLGYFACGEARGSARRAGKWKAPAALLRIRMFLSPLPRRQAKINHHSLVRGVTNRKKEKQSDYCTSSTTCIFKQINCCGWRGSALSLYSQLSGYGKITDS